MKKSFVNLLILAALIVSSCKKEAIQPSNSKSDTDHSSQTPIQGDDGHLLLGNPSNAINSTVSPNNYLINKVHYVISYNLAEGKANWVSWHLTSDDLGEAERQDDFRADNTLPIGWYAVKPTSYTNSGFDRGHYCPSADRTKTIVINSTTFVMTNMMPQAPRNNQNTWANLENETRKIINAGNEAYIIAGSYGKGGIGSKGGVTETIDNGNITVPAQTWKVIVVLPKGNNDLNRISTNTRVIAVNMPNTNDILTDWKQYKTTVSAIESATGYNLLSAVPQHIQDIIETKIDTP